MARQWKFLGIVLAIICQAIFGISSAHGDWNNFYENYEVDPPLSGGFG